MFALRLSLPKGGVVRSVVTAIALALLAVCGPLVELSFGVEGAQTPNPAPAERLTAVGWIFMLGSLSCVLTLVIFCYRRVLSAPRREPPKPFRDFHSA